MRIYKRHVVSITPTCNIEKTHCFNIIHIVFLTKIKITSALIKYKLQFKIQNFKGINE